MNWNITAGRPVYVQLIEQLELALVAGEFPPGSRIPPVRELAADAGVNPNTMQRALQDLESRGLLQAQRTAGRTVTANDTVLQALRRKRAATLARDLKYLCEAGYELKAIAPVDLFPMTVHVETVVLMSRVEK